MHPAIEECAHVVAHAFSSFPAHTQAKARPSGNAREASTPDVAQAVAKLVEAALQTAVSRPQGKANRRRPRGRTRNWGDGMMSTEAGCECPCGTLPCLQQQPRSRCGVNTVVTYHKQLSNAVAILTTARPSPYAFALAQCCHVLSQRGAWKPRGFKEGWDGDPCQDVGSRMGLACQRQRRYDGCVDGELRAVPCGQAVCDNL